MKADLFLVDTSVWLEVLPPGRGDARLRDRVSTLLSEDLAATTGMVLLELLGGARSETEYHRLKNMLSALHSINVGSSTWERASLLAFEARRHGLTLPFTDLLIATIAMEAEAVLVHRDRHFDALVSRSPLKVESYSKESRVESRESSNL